MAQVRLEHVTKTFRPGIRLFSGRPGGGSRRMAGDIYGDRAFAERAIADHSDEELADEREVRALDDLSLTVPDGETMAIVGPSGCGKSTLLRVVAGLETPDSGLVYYDERVMNDVPPKDRGIGMVFQNYALYPHMKSEGNLAFFFQVRHRPSEEMLERIRITSEIMGIGFDQLLARKPKTLSGGQQQRVAIGRCIVRDPALFLFDEPLSNLDAKLRTSTRIEIKRLLRRFGITALYVTHDQTEAITLGDRLVIMHAGKIEQLGAYQELMQSPANVFVAGFMGVPPMNLIQDWRITEGSLVSALGRISLPPELREKVQRDQAITLGFRSEQATILIDDQTPSDQARLSGKVINCEPHFAQHVQVINLQVGELIVRANAPLDMHINAGWPAQVLIPPQALYLFDQESGARIAP